MHTRTMRNVDSDSGKKQTVTTAGALNLLLYYTMENVLFIR